MVAVAVVVVVAVVVGWVRFWNEQRSREFFDKLMLSLLLLLVIYSLT